jgi:hypothetical protein
MSRRPAAASMAVGLLTVALACAAVPTRRPDESPTMIVDAVDLRRWMAVIADDSMQGRAAGTPGHDRAVRYLVEEATRIGLEPAGEHGGFLQQVPELSLSVDSSSVLSVDGERLVLGTEYRPFVGGRGTPRPIEGAEVIYGGVFGDSSTFIDRQSAAGRVVVLSAPPGLTRATTFRWTIFLPESRLGSAAAVAIESLDLFPLTQRAPFTSSSIEEPGAPTANARPTTIQITSRAARLLLGADPATLAPGALGRRVQGAIGIREERRPSNNVIAVLRGSDPILRSQYVTLGAHSDHLGVARSGVNGDSIFNGADDNASGTVALLAIARALRRAPPPPRSVLFVWHTAEEHGLVGAKWFVAHPTVPLEAIVAELNLDMVGRGEGPTARPNPPNHASVILGGPSSRLDSVVAHVNAGAMPPLSIDTADAYGVFCSSDHAAYADAGIPVAFFTTDKHDDWHRVTDEASRIDYERLRRVSMLVANVASELARHRQSVTKGGGMHRRSCGR